jgi:uncharacterized protein (DUF2461 family)
MPGKEQLLAIRRYLVEHHAELRGLLEGKKLRAVLSEFEGLRLARPPKGFAEADEAAMDLLRCRQWGVAATLPAEVATTPALVKEIVSRFKLAAPVVKLLNTPLAPKARKPLF